VLALDIMKTNSIRNAILTVLAVFCVSAMAQQPDVRAHVAALKESLTRSRQQAKKYQWTETQVVSLHGAEKSRKQFAAHYGPDGMVQKTVVETSPQKQEHGLRGRIIEKKKEEMTDYMKRAVALVKEYVPPDPAKIQAAAAAGKASADIIEPGRRISLHFRDYRMPGDDLSIDLDPASKRLLGANVKTYLDDPKDIVTMAVQFGELPDGTTYPSTVNLNAQAKSVTVQISNSDYRLIAQ